MNHPDPPSSIPPSSIDVAIVTLPEERWEEYRDLRLAALQAEPTAFGEPYARAVARSPEEWRGRLTDPASRWAFAERDGRLVGMAGAFPDPDESGVMLVVSVYIDAPWRGRGIGRAMLTSLLDRIAADDTMVIRLWVNDTNAAAIGLYASLGFQVVGTERDALEHDGRSYDELIMERRLRGR